MKVTITLDYWDGTKSKTKDVDGLEGVASITDRIAFAMMESGVASVTITKVPSLDKMVRDL